MFSVVAIGWDDSSLCCMYITGSLVVALLSSLIIFSLEVQILIGVIHPFSPSGVAGVEDRSVIGYLNMQGVILPAVMRAIRL